MIKAVIFDLDDTLISERQYIESGYHHISKVLSSKLTLNEADIKKLLLELLGVSSKNVFNRLFDKLGITYTKENIMGLVEEYRNHFPVISFFEDVLPCLEELKSNNFKTGIITDGYANGQRQKLKAVKANEHFKEIIVTDELGRECWKPHPKSFENMREMLDVEFNEMVYIGDNPGKDFYISSIYPIKTVRLLRENVIHKDNPYYKSVQEDYRIYNLLGLYELLDKI